MTYENEVYPADLALIVDAQDAELATLRAERDALKEALQEISEHGQALPGRSCDWGPEKMARTARAALSRCKG